jgi:hypothetical protein
MDAYIIPLTYCNIHLGENGKYNEREVDTDNKKGARLKMIRTDLLKHQQRLKIRPKKRQYINQFLRVHGVLPLRKLLDVCRSRKTFR